MLKKLLLLIATVLLSGICQPVTAAVDFSLEPAYIDSMETQITATDDYGFYVKQKITAYLEDMHGIYVNVVSKPGVNNIRDIDVDGPGGYDVTYSSQNHQKITNIKIGDEDKLYNGKKTWTVSYYIQGLNKNSHQQSKLSLSLVPAYWDLPIKRVKTKVVMPKPVDWDKMRTVSGHPNDDTPKLLKNDSLFKIEKTSKTLTITGKNLPAKYGASLGGKLPDNYWDNPVIISHQVYKVYGFIIILILIALFCWFKFGRERKPVETIEFYPPDNMDPIKMGYFMAGEVNTKHIGAMPFYFADKGIIKIEEFENKDKQDSSTKQFKFIKKIDKDVEIDYQNTLLKGMFSSTDTVEPDRASSALVSRLDDIREQVKKAVPNIYDKRSLNVRYVLLCLGMGLEVRILFNTCRRLGQATGFNLVFFIPLLASSYLIYRLAPSLQRKNCFEGSIYSRSERVVFGISVVLYLLSFNLLFVPATASIFHGICCGLLFVIYFVIVQFVKKRDDKWIKLDGKILGFKKFIQTAELDQLNSLVEEVPEYFYKILPYAYIFGLTEKWVKHFENMMLYQPSWYDGDPLSYRDWDITMSSTISEEQQSAFSSSESSSGVSSGNVSSGGSSSGGGFGGGGGGAW